MWLIPKVIKIGKFLTALFIKNINVNRFLDHGVYNVQMQSMRTCIMAFVSYLMHSIVLSTWRCRATILLLLLLPLKTTVNLIWEWLWRVLTITWACRNLAQPRFLTGGVLFCRTSSTVKSTSKRRFYCTHRRKLLLGPGAQAPPHFYDHGARLYDEPPTFVTWYCLNCVSIVCTCFTQCWQLDHSFPAVLDILRKGLNLQAPLDI